MLQVIIKVKGTYWAAEADNPLTQNLKCVV